MAKKKVRTKKTKAEKKSPTGENCAGGHPPIYKTATELQEAVDKYFSECTDKLTVAGLAYYLGYESRQSLYDNEKRSPEFSYAIKRARLFIENRYEERLSGTNCTGAIFALKNMGWKDTPPVAINNFAGSLSLEDMKAMIAAAESQGLSGLDHRSISGGGQSENGR